MLRDVLGEIERPAVVTVVVGVRVADRQPAVEALHEQQLRPMGRGHRGLRGQRGGRRHVEGRVVAQRVAVGQRAAEPGRRRGGLEHLQADPPHRRVAQERVQRAAVRGTGTADDHVAGEPATVGGAHPPLSDLDDLGPGVQRVPR
nr:hypothetical protein [Pseudonocardia sp. H11422]